MTTSNEELADQLKEQLMGSGRKVALGDEPAAREDENPLESDFFRAINAFRAARNGGDAEEIAAAEARLQAVVRSELTGGSCDA